MPCCQILRRLCSPPILHMNCQAAPSRPIRQFRLQNRKCRACTWVSMAWMRCATQAGLRRTLMKPAPAMLGCPASIRLPLGSPAMIAAATSCGFFGAPSCAHAARQRLNRHRHPPRAALTCHACTEEASVLKDRRRSRSACCSVRGQASMHAAVSGAASSALSRLAPEPAEQLHRVVALVVAVAGVVGRAHHRLDLHGRVRCLQRTPERRCQLRPHRRQALCRRRQVRPVCAPTYHPPCHAAVFAGTRKHNE